MKLLLGTFCIALKPCRSQSYFLGAVKRPFVFCESWLCLWIWKFVINLRKCFCVLTSASFTERVLSSNFSWARILLCFYSSWTREFTVAYACWLANLKLVEFPLNCQGNVNRNELEAKLKVNQHLFVACIIGRYSVCYIVVAQWLNCEKRYVS